MISHVHAERIVRCPFSVAAEYAAKHLRDFEQPTGEPIAVPLAALGLPFHEKLRRRVEFSSRVQYSEIPTQRGQSDEIHVRWRARTYWLPDFGGTLRFCIATYCDTLLILEGTYQPPLGILGEIFDELIGRGVAAATAGDLLGRVGDALESDERAFRAAHQPAL